MRAFLQQRAVWFAASLPLASLTLCAAAFADIAPPPRPHPQQVCTEQYLPVCGEAQGLRKTYANACFARAAGATVIAEGECTSNDAEPSSNR